MFKNIYQANLSTHRQNINMQDLSKSTSRLNVGRITDRNTSKYIKWK